MRSTPQERRRPRSTARPAALPPSSWRNIATFYRSSVGRKFVMAISGMAIFGFVVVHLFGTLKIFLGAESTNDYGEALRDLGGHLIPRTHLLWVFRLGLAASFAVHLHAAFSLDRRNRRARSTVGLSRRDLIAATYASRTMLWSGIIVGLFIVFHLADLTWGSINPAFVRGDAYNNQIASFQNPLVAAPYLLGVTALSVHLFHGLWSMMHSVGPATTRVGETGRRRAAAILAGVIGVGYASIPVAVQIGILDHAPV